jgi:hypothetical protein
MTLRELINLTLSRVGEKEGNRKIDSVIKNAVNHSYLYDLSPIDKRISTSYIPVINGKATLPDNIENIEKITPSLIYGERRTGNSILSERDITFTVMYSAFRDALVDDTDEPDLSLKLQYLMSTYACYAYCELVNDNRASTFLNEYNTQINNISYDDNTGEEVIQDILDTSEVE